MIDTLKDAQADIRAGWEKGEICKCCGQLVKLYPYSLNRNAAISLIWIYQLSKQSTDGWVHVQEEFMSKHSAKATAMSYILLKHWGFIVPKRDEHDPDKNASGYWTITDKGVRFVKGQLTVPKTAMVYNNRTREYRGEQVNIEDALTTKFSYRELMGDFYEPILENTKLL